MRASDPGAIEAAVVALARGEVVAIPTDTVYGLAVDPRQVGAADRLFAAKARPRTVELPVLVAHADQALELAGDPSPQARRLMARLWPGPLTLVLARRADCHFDLGENDRTVGVRCPDHPVPLAICAALGPIATTSANRHGEAPLITAETLVEALGDSLGLVLDAGRCDGAPSTVVDLTQPEPRLLRAGALGWSTILSALD